LENNLINGDILTVTGKTLAENLSDVPALSFTEQDIIHPLSNPIKQTGHIQILRGNLASNGSVAKITGKETPACDPHKKADAENKGHLSGDQTTISETPVAPVGATTETAT
jgi:dihydroxyacid dehydratase/phosphogluconate dehydratase